MSINTVIQILVDLIIGLMLAMAVLITRQQHESVMLATPSGAMLPGDLWELKRLGLQLLNVSKGGLTRG